MILCVLPQNWEFTDQIQAATSLNLKRSYDDPRKHTKIIPLDHRIIFNLIITIE